MPEAGKALLRSPDSIAGLSAAALKSPDSLRSLIAGGGQSRQLGLSPLEPGAALGEYSFGSPGRLAELRHLALGPGNGPGQLG